MKQPRWSRWILAMWMLTGCDDESREPTPDAAVDAAIDASDPCAACGDQMCVQLLNGPCGSAGVTCVPKVEGCEQPVCSQACDQAYCDPGGISTCMAAGCPEDLPGAFHCYGV